MEERHINLEDKLVGDIAGTFYVESYQRGYRWSEDEITRLLNDIYDNGQENYCLQPVVVRRRGENIYELIDGQQRLTTLYLIYKYISAVNPFYNDYPTFSIDYETREHSRDFLENIENIDFSMRDENIDFYFIANAYETISRWFQEDRRRTRLTNFFTYLAENVKIIWYEVGEDEDAAALFTRLNIGKIPLTSAELVKAMFLSEINININNDNFRHERQLEISLQWDNIERELHNNSLWYFLTNNNKNYQTRIDLILDLFSKKPAGSRDDYYTFFNINDLSKSKSLKDIWLEIQHTFLILKDWYEEPELYHKIGYLIASGSKTLQEIYETSHGKTKSEFKKLLDEDIKSSIKFDKSYSELTYGNNYKNITSLLLLFNVLSVLTREQRFDFEQFKNNNWSLEHIHAQQSKNLRTQAAWKSWLELHIPSVQSVDKNKNLDLINAMQAAINNPKLDGSEFENLHSQVIAVLSAEGINSEEDLDSISNLALLKFENNAALNNSTFDVKRNKIIELDKNGQYIPFCTKMAFLKYYTPSDGNQIHFWGQADRKAYIQAMNDTLKNYLSEPIILELEGE